jgi:hemerythrin-like domain-containing protein
VTQTDSASAYRAHRHTERCRKDPARYTWICPVDAQRNPAGTQTEVVDTRDMLVAHAGLVREFGLAPTAVRRVKPGDRKHARDVDEYLAMMCFSLHAHHNGEDTILWPVLRARLSAAESRLLDKIETQHANINDSIERVNECRRRWLDQLDHNRGSELAEELQTLYELVAEHIEDEERDVIPMAAAYLSEAEWHAINEGGKEVLSLKAMLFIVGMACYGINRELTSVTLYSLSAPVRLVLTPIARRMYVRRAARVHGTTRP